MAKEKLSSSVDMTYGPIAAQIITFAIPLLLGNLFQMLYNTVDTLVVGNFVGKEALAAVGSTSSIINVAVFFFNGFSIGAGVVISRFYGAHDTDALHTSIETTMAVTFLFGILFTVLGVPLVPQMLRFMSTPEDVFTSATTYLRIYFAGISGLLVYNMGSGILRAVGDAKHPLYFLILTSVLNIVLDLVFVIFLHLGIAGVAYATIISQFISAGLNLLLLVRSRDIYHFSFREMTIHWPTLAQILAIGLPAGLQSMITSFSNVFVQSYINSFGSSCMAGWSCFNKLEQIILAAIQSIANAATTFISQNVGAKKDERARQGVKISLGLSLCVTTIIATTLFTFARAASSFFSPDASVISYAVLFMRMDVFFLLFNGINHVLAGCLRGQGDSKGPMVIMLTAFVAIRQLYLFIGTRLTGSVYIICFAYPVGWVSCCLLETGYYLLRRRKQSKAANS